MRNSKKFIELFMPKLKGTCMTCKGSKLIHLQSNRPIVTQLIKRVNLHIITTHSDWQKGLHYHWNYRCHDWVVLQADSESSEPAISSNGDSTLFEASNDHFLIFFARSSQDSPTHFVSRICLSPVVNFPLG